MKKYFEPEMNISTFSSENVVTISGKKSDFDEYNNPTGNQATLSYTEFENVIEFN